MMFQTTAPGMRAAQGRMIYDLQRENERLRGASLRALDCLLGCVAPTGGCDDRAAYEDAIAALKRALLEQP